MDVTVESISAVRKKIRLDPCDGEALEAVGAMLGMRGELLRSFVFHRAAAQRQPGNASYVLSCAVTALRLSRISEAEEYIDRCLSIDPQNSIAWKIRGDLFLDHLDRPQDALHSFVLAIELARQDLGGYYGAACCYLRRFQVRQAADTFRAILPADADPVLVDHGMAAALADDGHYEEAIQILRALQQRRPDDPAPPRVLGRLYTGVRDFNSAEACYAQASALGDPHATIGYIMHWWRMGDYERARQVFRSKMMDPGYEPILGDPRRRWEGQSLRGKTLRLDVGATFLGDAIQFARFAQIARDAGAKVILQCPKKVRSLLQTIDGVNQAVAHFDPIPRFDYEVAAVWDLLRLSTPVESLIRTGPYLRAPAHLREEWRKKISSEKKKVGLIWRGSGGRSRDPYGNRSMSLENLRPLTTVPGVALYSLQAEPGRSELLQPGSPFPAIDVASDFPNSAAAIEALDLVITIDTSIAHLAGALGKRAFVMLPFDGYFLWLTGREDTPWYPGMRLFRQTEPGNWSSVVSAVARALAA
jgi:Flp pilus assembly protein TadD